jgi:hypothetical protein
MTRCALAVVVTILVGACGGDGEAASVSIASPEDGATVQSPVAVTMEAESLEVEPAGETREGAGHFHLMVDADCLPSGRPIPADEAHRHLADGADETEVALAPGEHTLCLQAGNGVHVSLDATHEITITVAEQSAAAREELWEGTIDSAVTTVGAPPGPCGSPTHVSGTVRLLVAVDRTVTGTYDVSGCGVSEPHAEFTGTGDDRAFHFPQLIVQTNGEPIPKVGETEARARLTNFQGAGGVGARWVTTWSLSCTSC